MGFLDKLRGKKKESEPKEKAETGSTSSNQQNPSGKRIKKYTSDGKPVYE